jgi:ribonucleoside-diphosphate reductase beta chain
MSWASEGKYPWASEYFQKQTDMFWNGRYGEVSNDIAGFNSSATADERSFIYNIFSYFVQADECVADAYRKHYMGAFPRDPGIQRMLWAFGGQEAQHISAYEYLLLTLGFPKNMKSAFQTVPALTNKDRFADSLSSDTVGGRLRAIAANGPFGEGLQLFGSFAMLLLPFSDGTLPGMTNIVTLSIRDENLHALGITKLWRAYWRKLRDEDGYEESPEIIEADIRRIARDVVEMEDAFIDFAFSNYTIRGLSKPDMHAYIRFLANKRLADMQEPEFGFTTPEYPDSIESGVYDRIDLLVEATSSANFFETSSTEYAKGAQSKIWTAENLGF